MRNIRLNLAYDGTNYVGWQVQPNGVSIQSTVEDAVRALTGETVRLIAAGRTDAGVHALGQVANFKTNSSIPCDGIRDGLQSHLPDDVVVRDAIEVDDSFHATYSAVRKRYCYIIHNDPIPLPFLRTYAYRYGRRLDAAAMHEAGQLLVGTHDFRCFESHFPNKASSVRTVSELTVCRHTSWPLWSAVESTPAPIPETQNGPFVRIDVVADGFLYNMVRAIVGTLLKVGQEKWTCDDVRRILASLDRSQAGPTAPAHGLYLVQVDYDE